MPADLHPNPRPREGQPPEFELPLDYVSPLPPVRSGIADYSRDLLPYLAPLCDLRVVRLPGQPLEGDLVDRWSPVAADEVGRGGRLPLYQMGNNIHHEGVMELALRRPGILVLHDLLLHHLLIELTLAKGDFDRYLGRLRADHGWIGEAVGRARYWGELGNAAQFGLTVNRSLTRRQKGVLVHSEWAATQLLEEDADLTVRVIPMAMPLPPLVPERAGLELRGRLGIGKGAPLLGSFGFQTPIKRTEKAIAALAQPELRGAHLLVAGEVSAGYRLTEAAKQLGVEERVHMVGFLDYQDFQEAIAACDLCLNLRYPSAGETSASLLRVMAVGKATVVSDYAQFAEFPDDVVVKVPLGDEEVPVLAAEVGRLLEQPRELEAMAARARQYVAERHDPGCAARAVISACRELASLEPPGDAPPRVEPATTMVRQEVAGELVVEGAELPWKVGELRRLRIRLRNLSQVRWLASSHEVGGVILDVRWRRSLEDQEGDYRWLQLPRDLEPGEEQEFQVSVRRPLDLGVLVVEPHLKGFSGFNALGGPAWVLEA